MGEFDSTLSCRSLLPGQVNARRSFTVGRSGREIFYRAGDVLDLLFEDAAPLSVGGESTAEYIRVGEKVKSGQKRTKNPSPAISDGLFRDVAACRSRRRVGWCRGISDQLRHCC